MMRPGQARRPGGFLEALARPREAYRLAKVVNREPHGRPEIMPALTSRQLGEKVRQDKCHTLIARYSGRSALFAAISYLDVGRNNFVVMVYDFEIPSGSFGNDGTCRDHGFWLCRERKRPDLVVLFAVVFVSEIERHASRPYYWGHPFASLKIKSL
jgi:hypothetical protein